MDKCAVLLVGMKPEVEGRLAGALGQQQAIRSAADVAAARNVIQRTRPSVAVVAVGGGAAEPLELVRELATAGVAVICVGAKKDSDLILAAMRAGAREYLVAGEQDLLDKTVQGFLETSGALRLGEVTAVVPAKGGMGGTTIAINLAGALHRQGKRVCVLDLGVELGDVLSFLDVKGTYSITDVAANTKRLDRELLDSSVPRHASGVWVLSQSEKLTEAEQLDAAAVTAVLRFLRTQYDHLILDGLRTFGDVALAALDVADRILLVVTQEVPAVRSAQRRAEIFRRLGYEQKQTMLVVNRYHKGSSITRGVIEQTVGLPVAAVVGNDFRALNAAVNRGVLLWDEAPRSVVAKDLEDLAGLIAPAADEPTPARFPWKLFSPKAVLHGAQ